jgi:hypothetical protein
MSTATKRRNRRRPELTIRWLSRQADGEDYGVVRISVGKESRDYFLRELPAEFGDGQHGYELTKLQPGAETADEVYHILIDHVRGRHTCECLGFLRWNRCKHARGLLDLLGQKAS